jgi:hypothetical protein
MSFCLIALKSSPLCPLEQKALELLMEASKNGKILRYNEAVEELAKLRVDRKTALRLLADFSRKGLLKQSCGHGVKIIVEDGGGR